MKLHTTRQSATLALSALSCCTILVGGCVTQPERSAQETEEVPASGIESVDRIELTPEALDSLNLTYARVEERLLTPSLEVPAELTPDPNHHATVGPRVAGRIIEVPVVVGARVTRGAPLAVLESDEVGRARAELIAATARVDVARRAATRARELLEDRVTSERTVEEAVGSLEIAEADLRAIQTRLSTFGVSAQDVSSDNAARVVLTSPISGTVVTRSVHVGQWVEPSNVLFEILDLDHLWLLASVYEREMRYVEEGQPVQVSVRAYPGEEFIGSVTYVGDTLDTDIRSVAIRVVLRNPNHRLKPGMFATARIQGTHAHEAARLLAIPWTAVQDVDGHNSVFVRTGEGIFELREIHIGERAGDYVEVLNGLSLGAEVVTEGSFLLKGELLKATLGEEESERP